MKNIPFFYLKGNKVLNWLFNEVQMVDGEVQMQGEGGVPVMCYAA